MISTTEVRNKFLAFFQAQGHEVVSSSSLVPTNDNTLLFTNAGMVQFKEVFLGQDKRGYNRATTSQRCVRAGGKHNDLENVGYTARHHTFFEMLGNFSFGDYFKEEAIQFAWQFLIKELGLPKEKLWVTVFEEDDEAYRLWVDVIGVSEDRISRIGAKDNFWQMGDTGPCGPCTEIFFDHGSDVAGGPPGTPEEDGDRYIEIWNIVFMQYDRAADGTLHPLPKPSVDTGMGLERVAAVLQGVHSNYEIDLFANLIKDTATILNHDNLASDSLKVIADHIRSCAFLITDGVLPSNEGRGYVLRRIIRRAARHGNKLGATEPFFHKLVKPLANLMGDAYPELIKLESKIIDALLQEEKRFSVTLAGGMKILNEDIANLQDKTIPGDILFKLYDTFGFPLDLTADIARERGLEIDSEGFEREMEKQRSRARASNSFATDMSTRITTEKGTSFSGYTDISKESTIIGLYKNGKEVNEINAGDEAIVLLADTPFYAESGGQIGDTGSINTDTAKFLVKDTQKSGNTLTHIGFLENGRIALDDVVGASVDSKRREAIKRHHSATHLLHSALKIFLSDDVQQKGSMVSENNLRFDFSYGSPVTQKQLHDIENWVNLQVLDNKPSAIREMSMDDAIDTGATALFGEKYGDVVRVVSLGDHSTELCGGTHVNQVGDIGLFRITSETGVASGVRRIEAISAEVAIKEIDKERELIRQFGSILKTNQVSLLDKLSQLVDSHKEQAKVILDYQAKLAQDAGDKALDQVVDINGVKLLTLKLEGVATKALREAADRYKSKLGASIIVLASVSSDAVQLVVGVDKSLTTKVKAGDLVNMIAVQVGGKGGGRPDMAMAGGNKPEALDQALSSVQGWLQNKV